MKILIEIPEEHNDLFTAECDITSREYSILKNGIIVKNGNPADRRLIEILCDEEEANLLLDAATKFYPEAVTAIRMGLDSSREL